VRRRSLLGWAASALPTLPFLGRSLRAGDRGAALAPEAEEVLRSLASAVLPASLGRARIAGVSGRFLAWVSGYREGAELDHGYGHTGLRSTGASPAAAYGVQLAALDRAARAEGGASFAALAAERQRALVEAALAAAKVDDLPERPDGRHVAADLLAFFFRSAEASDLCYGAAIGRDDCRGLPGSDQAPPPLAGR
jgi:hypothetical protein